MLVYIYTEDRHTVKDKMEDGGRLTPRKRDWHVQVARAETEIGDVLSRPFPARGGEDDDSGQNKSATIALNTIILIMKIAYFGSTQLLVNAF